MSRRAFDRRFAAEVGMSYDGWRRRAAILLAVERLQSGRSVKETAFELGYRSPSAFVAMVRRETGNTPAALALRAR